MMMNWWWWLLIPWCKRNVYIYPSATLTNMRWVGCWPGKLVFIKSCRFIFCSMDNFFLKYEIYCTCHSRGKLMSKSDFWIMAILMVLLAIFYFDGRFHTSNGRKDRGDFAQSCPRGGKKTHIQKNPLCH